MQISKMTMRRLPCPPTAAIAHSSSSSTFLPLVRSRSRLSSAPAAPGLGDATLPSELPVPLLSPSELSVPRAPGLRNELGEALRELPTRLHQLLVHC